MKFEAKYDNKRFVIEEDPGIGFYLYVYENESCMRDYLQDTLEIAKEIAEKEFGVPKAIWISLD